MGKSVMEKHLMEIYIMTFAYIGICIYWRLYKLAFVYIGICIKLKLYIQWEVYKGNAYRKNVYMARAQKLCEL